MIQRSAVNSLFDADVVGANDDKIGKVKQVYVDAETGEAQFVTVATGLFGTSESFVPLDDASFDGEVLHVGFDKATLKHAPRIENDGVLSEDEEQRIWAYYGGGDRDDGDRSPGPDDDRRGPADDLRIEDPEDGPPLADPAARLRRDPGDRRLRRHLWTERPADTADAPSAEEFPEDDAGHRL